ncbi:O-antigen ligase family protein [Paenibacillus polymyxa]|uniref:O-antigen ligase family protein n=1 Tax=Paenibacillus polymyxa TaxID=1406 RepID=UPI002023FE24|nr:O-antigen ligase family protein [Paenibacillus polymyxa]URJ34592.1 O-antigen ligase family protein [Paenibacillus polymyxa]
MKHILTVAGLLAFSIPFACQGLSPRVITISLLILLFSYTMLLPSLKSLIAILVDNPLLTLLMMYIAASCLWAEQEQTSSVLMVVKFLAVSTFGFYLVTHYTAQGCIRLLVVTLSILSVLNLLAVVLIPSFAIHGGVEHTGLWKGISGHKNTLGTLSLLSFVSHVIYFFRGTRKALHIGFILLNALLLIECQSTTSLVLTSSLFVFILFILLFKRIRSIALRGFFVSCSCLLVLLGLALTFTYGDAIASEFGKTTTLTGRTEIWQGIDGAIQSHYWFGHGYGSFWAARPSIYANGIRFDLTSSHSGFRDLWIDVGLIGLLATVILVVTTLFKIRIGKTDMYTWLTAAVFFLFIVLNNITDSRFLNSLSIYWIIFMAIVIKVQERHRLTVAEKANTATWSTRPLH